MKIGEIARRAGCQPVTVRYYERQGLMRTPERSGANYREYEKEDEERLKFIRHCRRHGMSLEEIRSLLAFAASPANGCAGVHELLKTHIANVEEQIEELQSLRTFLSNLLSQCSGSGQRCGILKNLRGLEACAWCEERKYKAADAE